MKPETTDKTIEEAVRRELEWDPAVGATHIDVTARDGASPSRQRPDLRGAPRRGRGARADLRGPSGRR